MISRCGWSFLSSFGLIVALAVSAAFVCPSFSTASSSSSSSSLPLVINTWPFTAATDAAWTTLVAQAVDEAEAEADNTQHTHTHIQSKPGTAQRALDALVSGCTACEQLQCDGTVGYGGSPDETGETTLDAMIMNGDTFEVGAVVDLRNVKNAIGVARAVMDYTSHTILAGSAATNFALEMGFRFESLETNVSAQMHADWKAANCQPNYRRNVAPDATTSCGPYKPIPPSHTLFRAHHTSHDVTIQTHRPEMSENNHDTISMLVIGTGGSVHAATSTNGARNKIAGRVGDSPVVGAGAYAESGIGACGATGDGDVMMRFLPSFAGVEAMRAGTAPQQAAINILTRIINKYPAFQGAIICADINGGHGGAAHNWLNAPFSYSIRSPDTNTTQVIVVPNINNNNNNNNNHHHHNKHKHHIP